MVNVTVKFNNRDYILSCEDGQEQELEKLSLHLNEKFEQLKNDLGNIGESKLLLISSIQVIDEMFTIKESIEKLKNQNKNLLERFKEIKSLSILYKEDKEREIQNLQSELQELKSKISDNEKNYSDEISIGSYMVSKKLMDLDFVSYESPLGALLLGSSVGETRIGKVGNREMNVTITGISDASSKIPAGGVE